MNGVETRTDATTNVTTTATNEDEREESEEPEVSTPPPPTMLRRNNNNVTSPTVEVHLLVDKHRHQEYVVESDDEAPLIHQDDYEDDHEQLRNEVLIDDSSDDDAGDNGTANQHELLEEDNGGSINVAEESEDVLNNFALPEDDNVLDPNAAALACEIEMERANGYEQRREMYEKRREDLIESGWTVEVQPSRTGIAIGDRVRENKRIDPQFGTVVGQILPGEEGNETRRKLWTVLFDGKEFAKPGIPGTSLQKLHDDRVFSWKIMGDSEPDDPVPPKDTTGIIGFDFEKSFESQNVLAPPESYDFPYMRLLMHVWPGKSTWLIV